MSVSSIFNSIVDKTQSAINASPLSSYLSHDNPNTSLRSKSHALGALQHQFRTLQMQYSSSTSPVQRMITAQKGVALDFESIAHDAKFSSRELFMWGQAEADDVKDISDRLAYVTFVQGSLAESLAVQLDSARSVLKDLRDAESQLAPKRNHRLSLQSQISRIEQEGGKGMEKRLLELRQQLFKAENDDDAVEKEIEIIKRKAFNESERKKWMALREYGERLILLAEASSAILSVLPSIPPTSDKPYTGGNVTAASRASLQRALDNFSPGNISYAFQPDQADLSRAESRSFGVTHAAELTNMVADDKSGGKILSPAQEESRDSTSCSGRPAPVNPHALNNSPTSLPKTNSSTAAGANHASMRPPPGKALNLPSDVSASVPPTVAETGIPLSAGDTGPGPSSGSLNDIKAKFESAEEEKKRLERQERERVLRGSSSSTRTDYTGKDDNTYDGDPPPYYSYNEM